MVTPVIKHATLTGAAANPAVLVDGPKWDATHTITGLENVQNVDTTNASNITSGTLAAAQMPALTGDITTVVGHVVTTLATVNSNVGTFGGATQVGSVTLNAKGLATAASNVTITPAVGNITGLGTGVAAFLATPSSANLASTLTDETGSGAAVFGTSPTVATPTLTGTTTLSGASSDTLIVGNAATSNALTVNSQGDIGVGTLLAPDSTHHLSFEIIRNTNTDAAQTIRNRNNGASARAVWHGFAGASDQVDCGISIAAPAAGGYVNLSVGGTTGGLNYIQSGSDIQSWYTNNVQRMSLAATAPQITLGTSGATPAVILNGATSGSSTIKAAAVAGSSTFQLPVGNGTNGYTLATDGSGNTSWAYAVVPNHISALTLSTAGSSATFGIAAGYAADTTNALMMVLSSAYTKTTSAWAVGTGNGSLDIGSIANSTWYHVYLIARSDTGVVDVLISTSASSPTMPTSYDRKRRIGAMKTNGSAQWTKFNQLGDEFLWDVVVADITATNPGTTAVTRTITVPTGVQVWALINVQSDTNGITDGRAAITSLDKSDETAFNAGFYDGPATSQYIIPQSMTVRTNTSAQIRSRNNGSGASSVLYIVTTGWIDRRGRDG